MQRYCDPDEEDITHDWNLHITHLKIKLYKNSSLLKVFDGRQESADWGAENRHGICHDKSNNPNSVALAPLRTSPFSAVVIRLKNYNIEVYLLERET